MATRKARMPIMGNHGRVVGHVVGNVFYKVLSGSKHFLQVPPSIAFDSKSLHDAFREGAEIVRIKDKETGTVYESHINTIMAQGFKINRGHGKQIAHLIKDWNIRSKNVQREIFK